MTIVNPETGEIMNGGLTSAEFLALRDAEQVIKAGLETFVEVGQALAEIRDSRLYRNTHGTFEAYCQERWGMDRVSAHRTIEAAEIVLSIDNDAPKPTNVGQARELSGLAPEKAAETMREAHKATKATGGKVTAKAIKSAVVNLIERQSPQYVERFPALSFYAERGRHEDVVRLGQDLAEMDEPELSERLETLGKAVAAALREERGESHPAPHSTVAPDGRIVPIAPAATEAPSPPRPSAAPASLLTRMLAVHDDLRAGRTVTTEIVRGLADWLHDFADDMENNDA